MHFTQKQHDWYETKSFHRENSNTQQLLCSDVRDLAAAIPPLVSIGLACYVGADNARINDSNFTHITPSYVSYKWFQAWRKTPIGNKDMPAWRLGEQGCD